MNRARYRARCLHAALLGLALAASAACAAASEDDTNASTPIVSIRGPQEVVDWCVQVDAQVEQWQIPKNASLDCSLLGAPPTAQDPKMWLEVFQLPLDDAQRLTLRSCLDGLPASLDDHGLTLAGSRYGDSRHALAVRRGTGEPGTGAWCVVGSEPGQIQMAVGFVVGPALGVYQMRRPVEPFDYLLYESPSLLRSGRWQQGADGALGLDPQERDDLAARDAAWASRQSIEADRLVLRAPPERVQELQPWLRPLAGSAAVIEQRLGEARDGKAAVPVEVMVEDDFEALARHLGTLGTAVVAGDGARSRLHVVVETRDHGADDFQARYELARLALRRAGHSLPPWIEDGAALWLAGDWFGRDWRDWLGDLAAAGVLPTSEELLAGNRQGDGSQVLWPPVAAAIVDALPGDTLAAKLSPPPDSDAARRIATGVIAGLEAPPRSSADVRPARHAATRTFHNGVSFAMANGVDSGYHAASSEQQLEVLRLLGVDAVSVMPFAYQPDPAAPSLSFMNHSPGSETDVGLLHVARRARERGLLVLWKPHLWIGHGSWPGDVEMGSAAAWREWFRDYRRYVVHHAVLAEHAGAEWFCVGVELGRTVARQQDWRDLVDAVRRVYSGRLTYAGNWWGDYEHVEFWDALDAVGVDAYFPLAGSAEADRAALVAGAREAVDKLREVGERWHRPVLLTEVGFAARVGAWTSPHEEGGDVSDEHQHLAWDVLLGELGKPPWLLGIYAWKVFTHPRWDRLDRPNFAIMGRPAEQVLGAYFQTPRNEPRVDVTSQ